MKKLIGVALATDMLALPYGVGHAEETNKNIVNYEQAL
jgi:hypothetical protein